MELVNRSRRTQEGSLGASSGARVRSAGRTSSSPYKVCESSEIRPSYGGDGRAAHDDERTMNFVGVVKRANNPATSAAADVLGQAAATRPSTRAPSALLALPGPESWCFRRPR